MGDVACAAERLAVEVAAVRVEHARADGKASVLVAASGVASSLLTAGWYGRVGMAAAAAWALCGVLALVVLMPRLPRLGGRAGFPAYAEATPAQVLGWLRAESAAPTEPIAAQLVGLSRLAVLKYRLVQASATAGMAALVLTAGAVL